MREKSNIILTGILLGLVFVLVSIGVIIAGSSFGANLEHMYNIQYEEVPTWATIIPAFICAFGFVGIVFGLITPFIYIKEWNGTPIEQNGKIIEIIKRAKNGDMVVLAEFSDGMRKELIASKKLYLSVGDHGFIGAQGKHLVYFKRN